MTSKSELPTSANLGRIEADADVPESEPISLSSCRARWKCDASERFPTLVEPSDPDLKELFVAEVAAHFYAFCVQNPKAGAVAYFDLEAASTPTREAVEGLLKWLAAVCPPHFRSQPPRLYVQQGDLKISVQITLQGVFDHQQDDEHEQLEPKELAQAHENVKVKSRLKRTPPVKPSQPQSGRIGQVTAIAGELGPNLGPASPIEQALEGVSVESFVDELARSIQPPPPPPIREMTESEARTIAAMLGTLDDQGIKNPAEFCANLNRMLLASRRRLFVPGDPTPYMLKAQTMNKGGKYERTYIRLRGPDPRTTRKRLYNLEIRVEMIPPEIPADSDLT